MTMWESDLSIVMPLFNATQARDKYQKENEEFSKPQIDKLYKELDENSQYVLKKLLDFIKAKSFYLKEITWVRYSWGDDNVKTSCQFVERIHIDSSSEQHIQTHEICNILTTLGYTLSITRMGGGEYINIIW